MIPQATYTLELTHQQLTLLADAIEVQYCAGVLDDEADFSSSEKKEITKLRNKAAEMLA